MGGEMEVAYVYGFIMLGILAYFSIAALLDYLRAADKTVAHPIKTALQIIATLSIFAAFLGPLFTDAEIALPAMLCCLVTMALAGLIKD